MAIFQERRNHSAKAPPVRWSAAQPITLVSAPAGYGKRRCCGSGPEAGPVIRLDPAETPDHWQLWQQVSEALSLSVVTVIIDDLHLMEHARGSGPLRDALRRASAKSTSGDRYPE